jgi:hypothetical protein
MAQSTTQLIGTVSNRSAIGARVTARYGGKVQVHEVLAQSSFYSVNDRRLHFGLGAAKAADLEVRWPNGRRDFFKDVPAGRLVTIREGEGILPAAPNKPRGTGSSSPAAESR